MRSNRRNLSEKAVVVIEGVLLLVVVVALPVGAHVLSSYFEARAYRNVTGKTVSTWDAMFLDLRVQAATKEIE